MLYGFEYFCGANVTVQVGDMDLLEAAGLSVNAQESKRPIYGYASRHFDAIASGQVLISGMLLINYVHQDYLFRAIQVALEERGAALSEDPLNPYMKPSEISDRIVEDGLKAMARNEISENNFTAYMQSVYWRGEAEGGKDSIFHTDASNPHDRFEPINLRVIFGARHPDRLPYGKTGYMINAVSFTGRSQQIQVSEEVVVEAYPFLARNVLSLKNPLGANYDLEFLDEDVTGNTNTSQ